MGKQERRNICAAVVYSIFLAELVAALFPCCRVITVPVPDVFFAPKGAVNIPYAFGGIFNLMGTIGLFLGFINVARLRRVKGILIDDVMGMFYPYYGVLFIFHALFTGIGFYASHAEDIGAISRCLFALVVCLAFESIMVYMISFSEFRTKKMTTYYIAARVQQFHSKDCTTHDLEADCFQIARHIRSQFASHQITFPLIASESKDANNFLALDIFLLFSFLQQSNETRASNDGMVQRFLINCSGDASALQNDIEKYAYTFFCLSEYRDQIFSQGEIVKCSNIWAELLRPVTEPLVQAEIILNVFIIELSHESLKKKKLIKPPIPEPYSKDAMCCGLVGYLCRNINFNQQDLISCGRLLRQLYQLGESIYSSPHAGERTFPEKKDLLGLIREVGLIFLSLSALIFYYSGPVPSCYNPGRLISSMYEENDGFGGFDFAAIAFCYADSIATEIKVLGYPSDKDPLNQFLLLEKAEDILNDMICS